MTTDDGKHFIYFIPLKTRFTNEAKITELNVMSKTIIYQNKGA